MDINSLYRFFRKSRDRKPIQRQLKKRPRYHLTMEQLEDRELLTVLAIKSVTPIDGSTFTAPSPTAPGPVIQVAFNEDVTGAANAAAYSLFDSSGDSIAIGTPTYSNSGGVFVATIPYNNSKPLPADTYTLFVHGDQILAAGTNSPLSQPGQYVVANAGTDNISTISMPGDGTLRSASEIAQQTTPAAVAFGDVNGDGIPDMLVLDSTNNVVDIYAGKASGIFDSLPNQTLALLPGAGAKAFVVANIISAVGLDDIAVCNTALGSVSIFPNTTSTPLHITFGTPDNVAVGLSPDGIVAADFNGDGAPDLAVSNGNTNVKLGASTVNSYYVSFILATPKTPTTPFNLVVNIQIGDVTPTGLSAPTGIAVGDFNGDGIPDVAVSGTGGVEVMTNTTPTGGALAFSNALVATSATTSVAAGFVQNTVTGSPDDDIVATTNNAGGQLIVLQNDGTGKLFALNGIAANSTPTAATLASLDNSGINQVLVANDIASGRVTVFTNASTGGFVTGTSGNTVAPILVTSPGNGLQAGDQVLVTGVLGNTAANGLFTVGAATANTFTLTGATGNAAYISGGTWSAVLLNNGTGVITGASNLKNQPITITSRNDGLVTGQQVTITGVLGNTAANGTFFVKVVDANDFQLVGSKANGNYTSGGTWALAPYLVDSNPVSIAVGDVNLDGNLDIATANSIGGDVALMLGNGDLTFRVATNYPLPLGSGASSVAVGDLNGDGLNDLVISDYATNQVTILLAQATGGYGQPTSVSTLVGGVGNGPVSVALADLTGKGILDIVVACELDSSLTILANNGSGAFTAFGTVAVGADPDQVVAGEFTGDGHMDLAVAHFGGGANSGGGVSILLGNGNRTFKPETEIASASGLAASALAVGDFNKDGHLDLVVADDNVSGSVTLELGDGTGNFTFGGSFAVDSNPTALAVADVNNDGYPDVIAVSNSGFSADNLSVLLNSAGGGFAPFIGTVVDGGIGLQSVTAAYVNGGPFVDLIVTATSFTTGNNVFTLTGEGDGTFVDERGYQAGGAGTLNPSPSEGALVSQSLVRATTFTVKSTLVSVNLIENGGFEDRDLSGEQGNLDGWSTYNEPGTPGSAGRWSPQTGETSPLSEVFVPSPPAGSFQAMLDQADQIPLLPGAVPAAIAGYISNIGYNPNTNASYAGSHALYQDIAIPAGTSQLTISFVLYIDNSENFFQSFTDTTVTPQLDFNTNAPNQQVRVDLVNPNALTLQTAANNPAINFAGVLQNLFVTDPSQFDVETVPFSMTINAAAYAGTTIEFRVAATNNEGKLIVGVDKVKVKAIFVDTQAPTLSNLAVRNPSYVATPSVPDPTTDPTLTGTVGDVGSINNISFIEFDVSNNGPLPANVVRTTTWDANGNFSFTIPQDELLPGLNTVSLEAVNKVGAQVLSAITFTMQGPSTADWAEQGPAAISTSGLGTNYTTVSGDITAIAVDPRDPTGNSYFVGAANGGIWKTTDGGNDWKVLTDNIFDASGNPVPAAIGGMALAVGNGGVVLYAGTGISNTDMPMAPGGVGLLKSTNEGATWQLLGQSVLTGARVSKVVVDPGNINIVYVAVTSYVDPTKGPALWRSTDGGLTWTNVLTTTNMYLPGRTTTLAQAGLALASVTDLVADPFTSGGRLLMGLGNIGQVPAGGAAGLWRSLDDGATWEMVVGGVAPNIPNNTIPSGTAVGRVTIGLGTGQVGDERFVYLLIGNPPPAVVPVNTFDTGTEMGLYKTKDNMLNWTKVMLKENIYYPANPSPPSPLQNNYVDINLLSHDASNVGSLAVDQNNPNVVYVGGSIDFLQDNLAHRDAPTHDMIRVDTSNMRDTTYIIPNVSPQTIPNDGDDITKAFIAANIPNPQGANLRGVNQYDPVKVNGGYLPARPYVGEGVDWYDLSEDSNGALILGGVIPGFEETRSFLPTGINVLTFDSQGRLLFGTQAGLYRGVVAQGFNYDLTSGGTGIVLDSGGVTGLPTVDNSTAMTITAINGNLEISEVTGVAIDPTNPARVYSSAFGTGTALTTSGPLGWTSTGAIGPSAVTTVVVGTPNATDIRVGAATPGVPAGTPSTVFRVWQSATFSGNFPEVSTDGGLTFSPVNVAGISPQESVGLIPAFAINPSKIIVNGVPQDQLLFGGQRVFLTDTSTNVWDPISPILSPGAFVSAVAFAPSSPGVYYAGTTNGQIFVETVGANWPVRSTGLPGNPGSATAPRINNIVVDPSNSATAFALLGGSGFAHIFKTTNSGLTWTPSNALAGGGTLPDVEVYSMVIDPTVTPGAPNGRYYLGTGVGVYISYDKGTTWQKLGNGLPNAAVVDLQFQASQQLLVAGVQGRGAFELSTRNLGPAITAISPAVPTNQALTTVTVTFNEAVDIRTFTPSADSVARTALAASYLNSNSYRTNRVIDLYDQYLRRVTTLADPNVQGFANLLQQQGEEQVVAALVSSSEYFTNPALGNSNNATWLNQVYLDLLHRSDAGDPTAASYLHALTATPPTLTRAQIVNSLVTSAEFRADEVAELYNQILNRNKPVPASLGDPEVAAGEQALALGGRVETLMANLLGSQEYYLENNGVSSPAVGSAPAPTVVPPWLRTPFASGVTSLAAGSMPTAVAVADLTGNTDANGTPILDLIVANSGTNTVTIYQGQIGGGYASTPTITLTLASGAAPTAIAVQDFNNDGKPDLAVADAGTSDVMVFLNTSSGGGLSFGTGTRFAVVTGSDPVAIVAAKIDAGSNYDLAVASGKAVAGKFDVDILLGNGNGTFGLPVVVDSGLTEPLTGLAVGNVDSAGLPDIVISASDSSGTVGGINLLEASAPLVFTVNPLTTMAASSVALGKIDSNSSLDIVATSPATGNVLVLQNQGKSPVVFGAPVLFAAGTSPTAVQIADLNGDGRKDIVVVNGTSPGGLTTLLNTTTPATPFDTLTFGNAVTYPVAGNLPVALALGDTSQDLVSDAVLAMQGSNTVDVLSGTNLGSFQMPNDQRFLTGIYKLLTGSTPTLATITSGLQTLSQDEQTQLSGPGGTTAPISIVDLDPSTHRTFQLTFAPQTVDGTYTLTIGPNVSQVNITDFVDTNGTYRNSDHAMDQNGNAANGEFPADRYVTQLAINTSDDGAFISGLYHSLLGTAPNGRPADNAGFINALAPVDAARFAALAATAPTFTTSGEYRTNLIQSDFNKYLRRPAGPSEVTSILKQFTNGQMTEEGLIVSLVSSNEYFTDTALGNSSNALWLSQVYQDLLGVGSMASDSNAPGYLTSLNKVTLTRAQVAGKLVLSSLNDKFLRGLIFADFESLLGRAPNDNTEAAQSEYQAFLPMLQQQMFAPGDLTPDEQLIDKIVTSGEYFLRVGNTNQAWIVSMYTKLLGRSSISATGPEVSSLLVTVLNRYGGARQTEAGVLDSVTEYKNRVVAGYYLTYLGRAASAGELAGWVSQMPPLSDEQVQADIVSSAEFYPITGPGSGNAGWLNKIYADLLHRSTVGDLGAANLLAQLNSVPASQIGAARQAIALSILHGSEYCSDLIASFYNNYLGRTKPIPQSGVDPEVQMWVNMLAAGATQEQVIAAMLGSAEYFMLPHTFP